MREIMSKSFPRIGGLHAALWVGVFFLAGYQRAEVSAASYDRCYGIVGYTPCVAFPEGGFILTGPCDDHCSSGGICDNVAIPNVLPRVDSVGAGWPGMEETDIPVAYSYVCEAGEVVCPDDAEEFVCVDDGSGPTVEEFLNCHGMVPAGGSCTAAENCSLVLF